MSISLTPVALERIKGYIAGTPGAIGLRFGVSRTGCSGWGYVVDLAKEARQGDSVSEQDGVRVYVDADEEVRAARRVAAGELDAVAARDAADSKRATAPLKVADGATVLDTSHHTIESGVAAALEILRAQGLEIGDR